MNTIADLIALSGGAVVVAQKSQDTDHPVTEWAVRKWADRERIPQDQWALIMALSGVSLEKIYRVHNPKTLSKSA